MLNNLLKRLAQRESSESVFNQYQDKPILNNLKVYFTHLLHYNPRVLIVGEAPGYRGCRLTGIPFTSVDVIKNSEHYFFTQIRSKLVLRRVGSENTAKIFWDFLTGNELVPVLWNAFPFHPHQSGLPETNRKPNISEIEEGKRYLKTVHDLFKPKKICSLGRVGESILKELFPGEETVYIRHPSHGGKKDFIKGMQDVCGKAKA